MCFVLGVNLGELATTMQLPLSSQTVHLNTGFLVSRPNMPPISSINPRKGITSLIAVDKAMYSLSVALKAISVYNLLPQVMGHPAYIITNAIHKITGLCNND